MLVHCGSSNRVGALYYACLVNQKGVARQEAEKKARELGLTSSRLLAAANDYLDQN